MEPSPAVLPSGVVTFLLTDIEDSTRLWEEHPADMATALERHDAVIDEVVSAHDGTVLKAKGEGDATLSVFRRASDAARAAHALAAALDAECWPGGLTVRVRLALHTGEAHERDGDYFGPTLNRAARIRGKAAGGQVLLSDVTATLVLERLPDGAVLTDLGEHELRGLARSERIWALAHEGTEHPVVTGPTSGAAAPEEHPALPAPLVPPSEDFVGRVAERAALTEAWQGASTGGAPRLVLLGGEPGVGKTRLAAELAREAHDDGALVLFGRCDEDLDIAYQPWAEALRALVAVSPPEVLQQHVARHGGEITRLVPDLSDRLPGAPRPSAAAPEEIRPRLFEAVTALLVETSQRCPVLLVTDDLHWADRPTLQLLRHLVRVEAPLRLLMVGTYRDTDLGRTHPLAEMAADLRREPAVVRVAVTGLSEPEVAAYLEGAAGHALPAAGRALAAALHDGTDGNPFFVGEVVRHLVDRGVLYEADGQWTSDIAVEDLGLPEGVREVVGRRLARLSDAANRALRVAALLGQTFTLVMLEAVPDARSGADDDLLDALDEIVAAGLLHETTGGFAFSHALVRQTLSAELTGARRSRLHRRIGEAIEALPDAEQHVEALAHHFDQAALDGQLDKATFYALLAGRRAIERGAYEDALTHLDRGLELLDLGAELDVVRRAELLVEKFDAMSVAASIPEEFSAIPELAEVLFSAARDSGRADLLARAAAAVAWGGILGESATRAVAACEEALAALGPEGDPVLRALVLGEMARCRSWRGGEGEAVDGLAVEAVELARSTGDEDALLRALANRGVVLTGSPDLDRRAIVLEETSDLARRSRDPWLLSEALMRRADLEASRGNRDAFDQTIAAVIASPRGTFLGDIARTLQRLVDGELQEAMAVALAAMSGRDDGALLDTSFHALSAGRELGLLADLLPLLIEAEENYPNISGLQAAIASWEGELGLLDSARARLARLLVSLASMPRDASFVVALAMLSETAAACGEKDAAPGLRDQLQPWSGQLAVSPVGTNHGAVGRYLGMLASLLDEHDEAESLFAAALSLEEGFRAPVLQARTLLWWGRARLAAGNEPGARELLERAQTIATNFGMAKVAADASALL